MRKRHIQLSKMDFVYLQQLSTKSTLSPRKQKRVLALLQLHQGETYTKVSKRLAISYPTVLSWAKKYMREGLSFLEDKPRSGRPKEISAVEQLNIIALAQSVPPAGHQRWTLRLLAQRGVALGICRHLSHNQVSVILKKNKIKLLALNKSDKEK